ncbi:YciI family protein [Microbacterium sp. MYb64]|uniref:YciI family protein n=1 Tax=Microbacterium sp. MYb64 TaxID=1848691 RepID=UPI000CFB4091|nr:YciI family protein [Microbacterium sp. MYb64]PRB00974.1 hypothetical protein CQ044_17845 [Microbacterium sp. MYb64]
MEQFVITAVDHPDDGAQERRVRMRPAHLARLQDLSAGRVLSGGAILGPRGTPIGSSLHVEFADRATLDAWLADDPYVVGRVWDDVEVRPFRQAMSNPSEL